MDLSIHDGSTVPSANLYGEGKTLYIDIGSGDVFKLTWSTPTLADDEAVDRYSLIIKRHDTVTNVYYDIFNKNVGLVNEFFVRSNLLPSIPTQYALSVYVVAYGKLGSVVASNVVTPYISKGTGTYVKATLPGYKQPIMKRAIAFASRPTPPQSAVAVLVDSQGIPLVAKDNEPLVSEFSNVLISDDWYTWNIMQEGSVRTGNSWSPSDIRYEVLVDNTGEIIRDSTGEAVYVL